VPHARNTTLARSGRTATGDRQYVCRVLGADVPPLGVVLEAQRLTADLPPSVTASTYPGCFEGTYRHWLWCWEPLLYALGVQ
jgi:hypothetical protein